MGFSKAVCLSPPHSTIHPYAPHLLLGLLPKTIAEIDCFCWIKAFHKTQQVLRDDEGVLVAEKQEVGIVSEVSRR